MEETYESQAPCPHCRKAGIQTVVTYPYIRGMLLANQRGEKRFAGCVKCAGSELRKEAGRSLLYGWFSPAALVLTLGYVPWNFFRSFFVKPNKEKVVELFREIGVPLLAAEQNPTQALYAAVAAMILADGKIDPKELEIAHRAAPRFIPSYEPDRLEAMLDRTPIPVPQIGALLKPFLSDDDKDALVALLSEIAQGDGDFDRREAALLRKLSEALGATGNPTAAKSEAPA